MRSEDGLWAQCAVRKSMEGCSCQHLTLPVVTQPRFEMLPAPLSQSSALLTSDVLYAVALQVKKKKKNLGKRNLRFTESSKQDSVKFW